MFEGMHSFDENQQQVKITSLKWFVGELYDRSAQNTCFKNVTSVASKKWN